MGVDELLSLLLCDLALCSANSSSNDFDRQGTALRKERECVWRKIRTKDRVSYYITLTVTMAVEPPGLKLT